MNKTKIKELEAISKDLASEFKYTDHLVNDPLSIGDFTIGKNNIAGSNLRRINTITSITWDDYKKKEIRGKVDWGKAKLKKVQSHFIPDTYDGPGIKSDMIFYGTVEQPDRPCEPYPTEYIFGQIGETQDLIALRKARINNYTALGRTLQASTETIYLQGNLQTLKRLNYELTCRSNITKNGELAHPGNLDIDWEEEKSIGEAYYNPAVVIKKEEIIEKELFYFDRLKQSLDSFKYNYGGNPSIIKGYIIEGTIVDSNEQLEAVLRSGSFINWEGIKTIIRVFNIKDSKVVSKIKLVKGYRFADINKLDLVLPILPMIVKFKIINSKNSNNFFITTSNITNKVRNSLKDCDLYNLNWNIELVNISRNKTKHSTYIILVEHPDTNEDVKFTISDCKFTNQSITGYNPPIDKTIKAGSIVRIKESKLDKYNIRTNSDGLVMSIRVNPSSKKISKECSNRRMDIVTIALLNKDLSVYAQDLKFIENKKKQEKNVNANIKKEKSEIYKFWYEKVEDQPFIYGNSGEIFTSSSF